jgi:hypothetical protein
MLKSGASHNAANNHQLAPVRAYNTAESAAAANPSSRSMFRTGAVTIAATIAGSGFANKDSVAIQHRMRQPRKPIEEILPALN